MGSSVFGNNMPSEDSSKYVHRIVRQPIKYCSINGFTAISGGWINHHWIQLAFQLASATATLGWSFGVSYVTLFTLNKIPYLKLRLSAEEEELGTDHAEIGEVGYEWYVEEMNPIQGLTPSSGPSSVNKDHEDAEKIPGTPQTSAGPA